MKIEMNETKTQLIQTGFTLDRMHQDGKIDDEAYTILKNRNKQAINYSQFCTELICDFDKINDGSLTKGKKYVKIHEHNEMVVIVNDFDEVMSYNKESFFEAN